MNRPGAPAWARSSKSRVSRLKSSLPRRASIKAWAAGGCRRRVSCTRQASLRWSPERGLLFQAQRASAAPAACRSGSALGARTNAPARPSCSPGSSLPSTHWGSTPMSCWSRGPESEGSTWGMALKYAIIRRLESTRRPECRWRIKNDRPSAPTASAPGVSASGVDQQAHLALLWPWAIFSMMNGRDPSAAHGTPRAKAAGAMLEAAFSAPRS